MRFVLVGASALALAACGDYPGAYEEAEAGPPAGDVRIEPGLYRMQITIGGGPDGSGMQYADENQCLAEEDVSGGYREMLLDLQGRDSCRFETYDLADGQLDAVMVCAGDAFQPETRARIAGTVTPEATDLRMTVAGFEEDGAGVDMRVTSERIGDCDDQDA